MTAVVAWIGLGSNLASPLEQITRAVDEIGAIEGCVLEAVSSFYETDPVGRLDQPQFINAVVRIRTTLDAPTLLQTLLSIETAHARVRHARNDPRSLDLDLLLYGDVFLQTEGLQLPHPRLHERAFVLVPMAEIDPAVVVGTHGTAAECLQGVDTTGVKRLVADKLAAAV